MSRSARVALGAVLARSLTIPAAAQMERELHAVLWNRVKTEPNVHGFAIDQFKVKVDVYRDRPETVEFVADTAGISRIWCHLHPAHLPGQLIVLE